MLNAQDISQSFSAEALEVLAASLMAAGKNGQAEAQPSHLIQVLNRHNQIKPILVSLGRTELKASSPAAPTTKAVGRVAFSVELKKLIYLAFGETLIAGSPQVTAAHFLVPLNDFITEPLDKQDLRQAVNQGNSAGTSQTTGEVKPTLKQFSENLTQKAKSGQLDPVIGREKEIDQLIRVLARRSKSNAILLGDPGVGKTAIVEGLALKIAQGQVPKLLSGVEIYNLNLTNLLAGASYQGELEERLQSLIKEVKRSGRIIIFIDEIHMIMGAGSAAGAMTAANILKPALARGDLNVIGATTQNEYRQYIEKDPALERRFEPLNVSEPSAAVTLEILKSVAKKLEKHHGVSVDESVLQTAIDLSSRYVSDRFLPDKAIDLLDEAASGAKVAGKAAITIEDLKSVLSQKTGIPVTSLTQKESLELMDLEAKLETQIIGQNQAVKAVCDVIKRARAGLKDPNRPTGSFLLLGPTGVGKTELAKALARTVYQSEKAMVRLDMSEFTEAHTADKLIGAPPGYVGYEEGGQLTNPIRRRPYSLILMDELEKAHPKVFDVFLQVLEDGRLTDSQGHTADFKNTIIIMTSNIDVSNFFHSGNEKSPIPGMVPPDRTKLMQVLSQYLRPEFLNRIDEIIVMNKLTLANIKAIARLQLNQVVNRLKEKKITLTIPDSVLDRLAKLGNVQEFGARPLKRLIQDKIEEPIAEMIISGKLKAGDNYDLSGLNLS
ncbi:MAG: ATP-dependent Clp protease ATP-binding subunit [Patescibacteria group bacterium]|nr:ATP-dependent Clp protease ATP-binding subunit [Patescibacteria group bacterium]